MHHYLKVTRNELINMASALWIQMSSPHLPTDCEHYIELDKLYTKLIKEIEHASHRQE